MTEETISFKALKEQSDINQYHVYTRNFQPKLVDSAESLEFLSFSIKAIILIKAFLVLFMF